MRELLDKYYEGQTTEEEEARLREVLLSGDVPDDLSADQELFLMMEAEKDEVSVLPDGFDQRLEALIEQEAGKEEVPDIGKLSRRTRLIGWIGGLAAAAAVALTLVFSQQKVTYTHEVKDPELACQYAEMALTRFSEALNDGYVKMAKAEEKIKKLKIKN